ncbi:MAG: fatty acid hydroxylase family protein, partial [Gammaproteobacteria bacterium]
MDSGSPTSGSLPAAVAAFRRRYRLEHVGAGYRGWLHLGFTVTVCVVAIGWCVAGLEQIKPLEWLTVPITFLYANLVEYLGHRGPMHHPKPGLRLIYDRHT